MRWQVRREVLIMLPFEMEDGAKSVKTLEGELIEPKGELFQVPFKFTDLPLAEKH